MAEDWTTYELDGDIALTGVNRPDRRNAMHDGIFAGLGRLAERAWDEARATVSFCAGPRFSAVLDLAGLARTIEAGGRRGSLMGPRVPHAAFGEFARGHTPAVAALSAR